MSGVVVSLNDMSGVVVSLNDMSGVVVSLNDISGVVVSLNDISRVVVSVNDMSGIVVSLKTKWGTVFQFLVLVMRVIVEIVASCYVLPSICFLCNDFMSKMFSEVCAHVHICPCVCMHVCVWLHAS